MPISNRLVAVLGTSALLAVSSVAMAQTPAAKAHKSDQVTTIGEGDALMIGPKGQRIHKSNVKVSTAKHQSAMTAGAKEIRPGTVIYKQNGKLYMLQDSANEKASASFQEQFDTDY